MKRVLFKIIIPAMVIAIWLITCYPVCHRAEGFDLFLYWVLAGCPFGIHRMCLWLIPRNFGIAGSMGVLALNCIVGGLIGGVVVLIRIAKIFMEIINILADHFWTQCPKVADKNTNRF